jgi:hypothetical protein
VPAKTRGSLVRHMSVMHTESMLDQKSQAEAMILDDLGSGNTVTTDMHGVDWDHHKCILEVRPAGHKTEIQVESDPRYDPNIIRENRKQQKASREQALLSGARRCRHRAPRRPPVRRG